jgi:hypothetical protein
MNIHSVLSSYLSMLSISHNIHTNTKVREMEVGSSNYVIDYIKNEGTFSEL